MRESETKETEKVRNQFSFVSDLSCLHITNNTSDKSYAVSIVSNK